MCLEVLTDPFEKDDLVSSRKDVCTGLFKVMCYSILELKLLSFYLFLLISFNVFSVVGYKTFGCYFRIPGTSVELSGGDSVPLESLWTF